MSAVSTEYLPRAADYSASDNIGGWLASEKYDGHRAFWDGRVLRSRGGHLLNPPASWLQGLPPVAIDGELTGLSRDHVSSVVKARKASWAGLVLRGFDCPDVDGPFAARVDKLNRMKKTKSFRPVRHYPLPNIQGEAEDAAKALMASVIQGGGEGVVIRNPGSLWTPGPSRDYLRMKPLADADARVIGFVAGRQTEKGSRYLGRIGALIVEHDGRSFRLQGLPDMYRDFATEAQTAWAMDNPGAVAPEGFASDMIPLGAMVTFRYRPTDNGIIDPRFWRLV